MDVTKEREIICNHDETISFDDGKITLSIPPNVSDEHMSEIINHITSFQTVSDAISYINKNTEHEWISHEIDNRRVTISLLYTVQ